MLEITESLAAGTVIFAVRIQPRANEALIEFLATLLKTSKSAVRILSGERSRLKRLEIRGVTKQQIERLITHDA